jgi:membrane protein
MPRVVAEPLPTIPVEPKAGEPPAEEAEVFGPRWTVFLRALLHPIRFVKALVGRVGEDRTTTSAASLAYFFFFSAFPFLLFLLAFVTMLPVQGVGEWLLQWLQQFLPPEAYNGVEATIRDLIDRPRGGLLSLGAVLALWSASSAVVGLMDALNRAYRVEETRAWWLVRLQAIGLVVGLSTFMIVAFVLGLFGDPIVNLITSYFGPAAGLASTVIRWVVVVGAVTLMLGVLYHVGPNVKSPWRWITPGSMLVTVGFGATSVAFSYYVSNFGSYNATYGSLGAVIILLFWLYLFAVFLVLGGQLNALVEHLAAAEQITPKPEPTGERPGDRARA